MISLHLQYYPFPFYCRDARLVRPECPYIVEMHGLYALNVLIKLIISIRTTIDDFQVIPDSANNQEMPLLYVSYPTSNAR